MEKPYFRIKRNGQTSPKFFTRIIKILLRKQITTTTTTKTTTAAATTTTCVQFASLAKVYLCTKKLLFRMDLKSVTSFHKFSAYVLS